MAPNAAISVPVAICLGYSIIRVIALATDEIHDWIFAKVQERALRLVSVSVLKHLTRCRCASISTPDRGLSRAIERGNEDIEFLVSYLVFHIAPIFLEIVLVAAVLWTYFNFGLAAVTLLVVILYGVYTAGATQWRISSVAR